MKKAFIFILVSVLSACSPSNETKIENTKTEELTVIKEDKISPNTQLNMTIEGMTCEIGCVRTVRSHLSKLKGVSIINIDFDSERELDYAKVQFDSNYTSLEIIKEDIESIAQGIYTVSSNEIVEIDTTIVNE